VAGVAELSAHEAAMVAGEDRRLLPELLGQGDRGPTGVDLHRLLAHGDDDTGRRGLQSLDVRLVEADRPGDVGQERVAPRAVILGRHAERGGVGRRLREVLVGDLAFP
jgi:hypothetical protein